MKTPCLRLCVVLSVAVLLVGTATPALGLANRVFVSQRSGNDANSCSNILAPCQTFAGAVLQLNSGGEAIVLDSGGYGPVTITQSLTIEAPPGVLAFIHPPSGDAITVSAGASDTVILRGLTLNVGSGTGINVSSVGALHIENCVIGGFETGLYVSTVAAVFMKDTIIRNCANGAYFTTAAGVVTASVERCRFEENNQNGTSGLTASNGAQVSVKDSVASGDYFGFTSVVFGAGSAELNVQSCLVANNAAGGVATQGTGAVARISDSSVTDNSIGLQAGAGTVMESLGNNLVRGNSSNVSGTVTTVPGV